MKRVLWVLLLINGFAIGHLRAQTTASFNFSLNTQSVSGWTNVHGDPSVAVRTATGPSGIDISSIATANWAGFNSTAPTQAEQTAAAYEKAVRKIYPQYGAAMGVWEGAGDMIMSVLNIFNMDSRQNTIVNAVKFGALPDYA